MTDLAAVQGSGHASDHAEQGFLSSVPNVPTRAHLAGHAVDGTVPRAHPLKGGPGAHPDRADGIDWRRKVKKAIAHRARVVRRQGIPDPYPVLAGNGWDPALVEMDGRHAEALGCPGCGGPVPSRRLRVRLADVTSTPIYGVDAEWSVGWCSSCSCRRAA